MSLKAQAVPYDGRILQQRRMVQSNEAAQPVRINGELDEV